MKLHEIYQPEELEEGPFAKAMGGAALAGMLATAPMSAKADTDPGMQGIDNNQPVATQVAQPQGGEKLVGNFVSGMNPEQVAELSGGKVRPNGISTFNTTASLTGMTGLVDSKDLKVYAKVNGNKTYFEFNDQNQLVGVHTVYHIKGGSPIKKGEGFTGFKRAELGAVFNRAYNSVKNIAGSPTGKAKSSDGGGFGLGVGGVTSGGTGVAIGLDKIGMGSAWVATTNGYVALDYVTQKGVANNFRPANVVVGHISKSKPKDLIQFESK